MRFPTLYTFNSNSLEYERVAFKYVIALPLSLFSAVLFNYLYFRAEIIERESYTYRNNKLVLETEWITVEKYVDDNK